MRSERVSTLVLLAGLLTSVAARPDIRARSQQIRRQNAADCLEDLEDILDDAPTTSQQWPATACDFTSTLSGAELTVTYASFRSRMASWYSNDLEDITKLQSSCTQYISVFDQIRYCYVTGPVPTTTASTSASATAATITGGSASRTSTGATSTSTSSSTSTPSPDDGGGLDPGAKAGLAIGIVLAVILILFICWKFFQRYRANRLTEGSGPGMNGDQPQMHSAAAIGGAAAGAAGAGMAAAAARTKLRPAENSVYAYKSELSGESRPISELDPAAAVAPRNTHPNIAELDPEPPTQLSELPADNYDPTANGSPPPAYMSPMTDTNRNTLDTAVSPLSPDSNTMQTQGLGISNGGDLSQGTSNASGSAPLVSENQTETVQHGWGRGWLRRD